MLYGRAEFESFEVESKLANSRDIAVAVIDAAGFGDGSTIISTRHRGLDEKSGKWLPGDELLEIVKEGVGIDPGMYLMVRNPHAEVKDLGSGKFWVGFDTEFDRELVGIVRDEVSQKLQAS